MGFFGRKIFGAGILGGGGVDFFSYSISLAPPPPPPPPPCAGTVIVFFVLGLSFNSLFFCCLTVSPGSGQSSSLQIPVLAK